MCGIIGYVGNLEAKDVLYQGLRKLEYRGYDSAGVCVVSPEGKLECVKAAGNLDVLARVLDSASLEGFCGVGHTRWATHGAPLEKNAHPHLDCKGEIAVVHNGIIENFTDLRRELQARGHRFTSETDTEVISHLIEENYDGNLLEAVRQSLEKVEGSFAIVAVHRDHPDLLVGARRDSPLVIGVDDGGFFIASAIPAFLSHTRAVLFLEDDELISVGRDGMKVERLDGGEVERKAIQVDWDESSAEKGGHADFMLKEIFEQPKALMDTIRDKLDTKGGLRFEALDFSSSEVKGLRRIVIVACGTSYHAALVAKYLFEKWVSIPVEAEIASEFRYRNLVIEPEDLVIAVSQSGETADTLAGVREAKRLGARVVSVVNVVGSQMTRESDGVIYTHAGPEVGVAATKTFSAQMAAMYLLGAYLGLKKGIVDKEEFEAIIAELKRIISKVEEVLRRDGDVGECARRYYTCDDFLFLGRGLGYPVAMEGALKLKEISYIHAEGYPAGEMKHGPIALLDKNVGVVAVAPRDGVYEKIIGNIEEVKARGAPVIGVATLGDSEIGDLCDDVLWVPETLEIFYPLLTIVPLQIFAYRIAKLRGCNVDQPRNLAKTVTVE